MDSKRLTLQDLIADGVDVDLHCRDCGNGIAASAQQMAEHFGPALGLAELRGHLRCPLCGSQDISAAPGPWARHARQRPVPRSRREWN